MTTIQHQIAGGTRDEAVLLSDRIVMLTNGSGANIDRILDVDIPRPRKRMDVVEHPS